MTWLSRKIHPAVAGGALGLFIVLVVPDPGFFHPISKKLIAPMPYRVPARQGMAELRLAMVHDVVTERYVRHGAARDQALRIQAEQRLATAPDDLDAYDDAALAAERLGDNAAAEKLLRSKAERQRLAIPAETADIEYLPKRAIDDLITLTQEAQQRYRTYANLGTVLLHGALPRVLAGKKEALPSARSGIACLEASVRLDPGAHFGRERWQLVVARHLVMVSQDPAWLKRCDVLGNRLDHIRAGSMVGQVQGQEIFRKFASVHGTSGNDVRFTPAFSALDFDRRVSLENRLVLRQSIARLEPDRAWKLAMEQTGSEIASEAFDQPVLGILGMWTLGGGANPHFALALGNVMERVGQGALAFACYERAVDLAPSYSSDPEIRQWFVTHLANRQAAIAVNRGGQAWATMMRAGFRAELTAALAGRAEFQAAEAGRLAAGGNPLDPVADAQFWGNRARLASMPGREDELIIPVPARGVRTLMNAVLATSAGAALFYLGSLLRRRKAAP